MTKILFNISLQLSKYVYFRDSEKYLSHLTVIKLVYKSLFKLIESGLGLATHYICWSLL